MQVIRLKTDFIFNSLVLSKFLNFFFFKGLYYKYFLYFFFFLKILKKKGLQFFFFLSFILSNYFFAINVKTRSLGKKKKTAKKFKRKRKKKINKQFRKFYYLKVVLSVQKRFFKLLNILFKKCLTFQDSFYILSIYCSCLFFFFFCLDSNLLKTKHFEQKKLAKIISYSWSFNKNSKKKKNFRVLYKKFLLSYFFFIAFFRQIRVATSFRVKLHKKLVRLICFFLKKKKRSLKCLSFSITFYKRRRFLKWFLPIFRKKNSNKGRKLKRKLTRKLKKKLKRLLKLII